MPDPRSSRQSSRTALQESLQTRPRARAGRRLPARRQARLCDERSRQTRLRQAPGLRSRRSVQSTPPFGLVFPGMRETRHRRGQVLGLFSFGLSVFALSALMLFPVLAQAEDSSGIQYSEAPPTATGGQGGNKQQGHKEPAANSSSNKGNSSQSNDSGHSKSSTSSGGSSGKNPSQTVNAQNTSHDGGTGQGNSGNGSNGGEAPPVNHPGQASSPAPEGESGGSSPLVPILIAIAALAAISIGAVMLRARRQRAGRGGSVSPEAS